MQLTLLQEDAQPAAAKRAAARRPEPPSPPAAEKSPDAFKTISEVANIMDVPQHVLRFWESQFPQVKPLKLAGGRRYYRPEDIGILAKIQNLLYKQGYTIKGARKAFGKEKEPAPAKVPVHRQSAPGFDEKQMKQIASIRSELMGLKSELESYL